MKKNLLVILLAAGLGYYGCAFWRGWPTENTAAAMKNFLAAN